MCNNPDNIDGVIHELYQKHILLGFPGVGGISRNNIIEYIQIKQQETTIGEANGKLSKDIERIKALFEKGGFRVKVDTDMQAWLKIHAVFIACTTAAIVKEKGSSVALGKNRSSVIIMVQSIREGFTA